MSSQRPGNQPALAPGSRPAPAPAPAPNHASATAAPPRQLLDEPLDRPPRRITVVAGIVSATILFFAILALFLFRSLDGREPPNVAVIAGNPNWIGAEVIVTSPSLARPYTAFIDRRDRYSIPFFLPPGRYELQVMMEGAEAYRDKFELSTDAQPTLEILLPAEVPATGPAIGP